MRGGPYAAIALAVVSVSFSAIFISWSTSPFITIAVYRLALASLILAPFALLDRRRPLRGISRRDALIMIGVGAILATHFTLWIGSLKIEGVSVNVASSVILVTSHPLLVGVLSHYVLRESLLPVGDWRTELALFLAMAVIPQIGGHTLYNWSLRWVTAPVVSLSLVGEPIGSSLLAWALLSQAPGAAVGIGGALALGGIYLTVLGQGARTQQAIAARDVE